MKKATVILLLSFCVLSCKKKEKTYDWNCKSYTTASWSATPIDSTSILLTDATEKQAREQEKAATYQKSVRNNETGEHDMADVEMKCVKQ